MKTYTCKSFILTLLIALFIITNISSVFASKLEVCLDSKSKLGSPALTYIYIGRSANLDTPEIGKCQLVNIPEKYQDIINNGVDVSIKIGSGSKNKIGHVTYDSEEDFKLCDIDVFYQAKYFYYKATANLECTA